MPSVNTNRVMLCSVLYILYVCLCIYTVYVCKCYTVVCWGLVLHLHQPISAHLHLNTDHPIIIQSLPAPAYHHHLSLNRLYVSETLYNSVRNLVGLLYGLLYVCNF